MFTKLSLMQMRRRVKDIDDLHKAIKWHNVLTKKLNMVWWLAWCGALAVFFMKVSDTSSWALQYSTQTQESVGYWVMGLGAGFVLCLVMTASVFGEKKALTILGEEWAAKLNNELAEITVASEKPDIGDGEKTKLVSRKNEIDGHLRRLETV